MKIIGLRIAMLIMAALVSTGIALDSAYAKKERSKSGKSKVSAAAKRSVQTGKAKASNAALGVNLQTDIQFGANTLHGTYQTPAEALAKVEDEKNLNDLLIPRTHFKDRMTFEAQGNE